MTPPKNEKTLDWKEDEVFWSGAVELSITSAVSDSGTTIYSMMFGRVGKTGERVSGFLRPQDFKDIRTVCDIAEAAFTAKKKGARNG